MKLKDIFTDNKTKVFVAANQDDENKLIILCQGESANRN